MCQVNSFWQGLIDSIKDDTIPKMNDIQKDSLRKQVLCWILMHNVIGFQKKGYRHSKKKNNFKVGWLKIKN